MSCVFCDILEGTSPASILHEDAQAVAFLERSWNPDTKHEAPAIASPSRRRQLCSHRTHHFRVNHLFGSQQSAHKHPNADCDKDQVKRGGLGVLVLHGN